jgi:hypothetical protein
MQFGELITTHIKRAASRNKSCHRCLLVVKTQTINGHSMNRARFQSLPNVLICAIESA